MASQSLTLVNYDVATTSIFALWEFKFGQYAAHQVIHINSRARNRGIAFRHLRKSVAWPRVRHGTAAHRATGFKSLIYGIVHVKRRKRAISSRAQEIALLPVQSILANIMARVSREHPHIFARLGKHRHCHFLIDARPLPFLLDLRPDPLNPILRALPRTPAPEGDARIAGNYRKLARMLRGGMDGDALFFSRDIEITGNLEAVVCLGKAIDDVEGSILDSIWRTFGPTGGAIRRHLDRIAARLERAGFVA